ncbi:MAG: hypothetical protein HFF50_05215 [Lawsonibacter sp.]|nr:hypothetical protein [Lawsonibacter sp.]
MKQTISAAYQYALGWQGQGNAATFIPELTKEDPNQLGICVTTCGGEQVSVGGLPGAVYNPERIKIDSSGGGVGGRRL